MRIEFKASVKAAAWKRSGGACEAEGCQKPMFRRRLCAAHYSRLLRHGDLSDTSLTRNPPGTGLSWLKDHINYAGNECLIFPFPRPNGGYGRVALNGQKVGAHRVMCILVHGKPDNALLQAAHSCGNGHKGCVNPNHLRWATVSENHADKIIHGTDNRGARHGNSKLSVDNVLAIRELARNGAMQRKIGTRFGIGQSHVSRIVLRKEWGWL